ncbi:MAG: nitroreductase family deazaflavin-dependent oxidoreductase [Chloroflexota bacterium]|nr:nitroreductase family deazaflavin-dependent oxidoreductase [Chloroflexota bacterium]
MAPASVPTRRLHPPRFLYRILNPVFKLLLRSPLHRLIGKRLMLLAFTGRRSGRRYTIPAGYAQVDNVLLLGTSSAWHKNLHGASVGVLLCGQKRAGTSEVITDEEGMVECYEKMLAIAPGYGRAIGVSLAPDGQPNRADVARARQEGVVAIRIQLD